MYVHTSRPVCAHGSFEGRPSCQDCMLDDQKNQGVMAVWGNLYRNPFSGGFSALPQEHSWQRLGSYTKTGQPAIRDALR